MREKRNRRNPIMIDGVLVSEHDFLIGLNPSYHGKTYSANHDWVVTSNILGGAISNQMGAFRTKYRCNKKIFENFIEPNYYYNRYLDGCLASAEVVVDNSIKANVIQKIREDNTVVGIIKLKNIQEVIGTAKERKAKKKKEKFDMSELGCEIRRLEQYVQILNESWPTRRVTFGFIETNKTITRVFETGELELKESFFVSNFGDDSYPKITKEEIEQIKKKYPEIKGYNNFDWYRRRLNYLKFKAGLTTEENWNKLICDSLEKFKSF